MPHRYIKMPVVINSCHQLHAFADSAASLSLISLNAVQTLKLHMDTTLTTSFNQLSGTLSSIGRCSFTLTIGSRTRTVTVDVSPELEYPFLLGMEIGEAFGLVLDLQSKHAYLKHPFNSQQVPRINTISHPDGYLPSGGTHFLPSPKLQTLLNEFNGVFAKSDDDLGTINIAKHKIRTTHNNPIYKRSFRLSLKDHDVIRTQARKLLSQNRIRPSVSPYNFPVFTVPKKDGGKRMVLDYQAINAVTVDDRQPLPLVQDVIDRLSNKKFFSVLDIAWGFWQVPMDPEDIPKTAFSTLDGHYEWVCMPMGLKGAPATFQRIIQIALGDLLFECSINYMDDVIVYSDTLDDHLNHLRQVLIRLQNAGVKLKMSKCLFLQKQVEYLGFLLSYNKVTPAPSKIDAIRNFVRPNCKRDVQRFLGLCNYLRRHIPNYTEKGHHLMGLTGDKPFVWTPDCEKNFEKLKSALTSDSCLSIYNPKLTTELHTDASKVGIGGMLVQWETPPDSVTDLATPEGDHQKQSKSPRTTKSATNCHVIAYFSQKLSEQQGRWNATELEAFAVKESCLHFKHYLSNGPFTIYTDHSALTWAKDNPQNKAKLHRWFSELSEFDYKIVHRKGRLNQHVDALSRAPSDTPRCPPSPSGQGLDGHNSVMLVAPNPITRGTLVESQSQLDLSSIKKPIMKDGVWCVDIKGHLRTVVPPDLRPTVLEHYHNDYGHPGTNKTLLLVRHHFWWPNYTLDVAKWVKECESCILVKSRNQPTPGPLVPLQAATQPFERFGIDTIILGRSAAATAKKVIINFVDHFSRFVWSFACKDNSTNCLINCLDTIIKASGRKPSLVVTDQGKNYVSKDFRKWLENHDIKWRVSSPYHPQTNGMVEKMNHSLVVRLRIKCHEKKNLKWSSHLPDVVSELNATPHEITGFSAEYLMYGNGQPCDFNGTSIPLEQARALALKRTQDFQEAMKEKYDRKHRILELHPGDLVVEEVAANHPDLKKLDPRFKGHLQVVSQKGPNTYLLLNMDTGKEQIMNTSRLRLLKRTEMDSSIQTSGE